jgi:hypothetical protein
MHDAEGHASQLGSLICQAQTSMFVDSTASTAGRSRVPLQRRQWTLTKASTSIAQQCIVACRALQGALLYAASVSVVRSNAPFRALKVDLPRAEARTGDVGSVSFLVVHRERAVLPGNMASRAFSQTIFPERVELAPQ